ncbi:ABC transporter substrate-binding protein [Candidatus Bathyarchaeota archaeon]|nr:ABC transporter substrate-binding protein [Candidatus Bathyarchaeota archaeon]
MSNEKMERRKFLKYAATAIISGAVAGAGGFYSGRAGAAAPKIEVTTTTVTAAPKEGVREEAWLERTCYMATPPLPEPVKLTEPLKEPPWICGWIGAFDTDSGRSSLRGVQIAIDEINAAGGVLGRPIKLVAADAKEDVEEAIKAYEFLATEAKADFIISGDIDDDTMGWLPRVAEYRIPTCDNWTTAIRAIERVVAEYDKFKPYFMNCVDDWFYGVGMTAFAKDELVKKMGFKTAVLLWEDTTYAHGVAEWVRNNLAPEAGIEILDQIVYDVYTVDFSPIYRRCMASGADFIYIISSVRCVPPTVQYVELEVPLAMPGINVAADSQELWEDTGNRCAGITVGSASPVAWGKMDKWTARYLKNYRDIWGVGGKNIRPKTPQFSGFTGYYAVYNFVRAAQRSELGFCRPAPGERVDESILNAFVTEMEKEDLIPGYLDDKGPAYRFRYYKPGEKDPYTGYAHTHNVCFDNNGYIGNPHQWWEFFPDVLPPKEPYHIYPGWAYCVYPPRWKLREFTPPTEFKKGSVGSIPIVGVGKAW